MKITGDAQTVIDLILDKTITLEKGSKQLGISSAELIIRAKEKYNKVIPAVY